MRLELDVSMKTVGCQVDANVYMNILVLSTAQAQEQ